MNIHNREDIDADMDDELDAEIATALDVALSSDIVLLAQQIRAGEDRAADLDAKIRKLCDEQRQTLEDVAAKYARMRSLSARR